MPNYQVAIEGKSIMPEFVENIHTWNAKTYQFLFPGMFMFLYSLSYIKSKANNWNA